MTYLHIRLPTGFTVRDLEFIFDVFRRRIERYEEEYFSWNGEELDCGDYEFDLGELMAIRDDFVAHDWFVRPEIRVEGFSMPSELDSRGLLGRTSRFGGEGE